MSIRTRKSYSEMIESEEAQAEANERTVNAMNLRRNKFPVKEMIRAIFLFTFGAVCLTVGALMYTGYIPDDFWERGIPVMVLGGICFIPGSYICFIAYQTWRGRPGYTYSLIPQD
eukprot:ANDGO_05222.mRNA.1 hypothetical protein H696_00881